MKIQNTEKAKKILSPDGFFIASLTAFATLVFVLITFAVADNLAFWDDENHSKYRTLIYVLVAIFGFPLLLVRTWTASRQSAISNKQAKIANDQFANAQVSSTADRFQKAVEMLVDNKVIFRDAGRKLLVDIACTFPNEYAEVATSILWKEYARIKSEINAGNLPDIEHREANFDKIGVERTEPRDIVDACWSISEKIDQERVRFQEKIVPISRESLNFSNETLTGFSARFVEFPTYAFSNGIFYYFLLEDCALSLIGGEIVFTNSVFRNCDIRFHPLTKVSFDGVDVTGCRFLSKDWMKLERCEYCCFEVGNPPIIDGAVATTEVLKKLDIRERIPGEN